MYTPRFDLAHFVGLGELREPSQFWVIPGSGAEGTESEKDITWLRESSPFRVRLGSWLQVVDTSNRFDSLYGPGGAEGTGVSGCRDAPPKRWSLYVHAIAW